jgi:drug/metabolite transporter (DMT)-like permease
MARHTDPVDLGPVVRRSTSAVTTQPLFVALAGALFLGEHLSAQQFAGGGMIVLGVLVTSLTR